MVMGEGFGRHDWVGLVFVAVGIFLANSNEYLVFKLRCLPVRYLTCWCSVKPRLIFVDATTSKIACIFTVRTLSL